MSVEQLNQTEFIRTIDTDENVKLGSFKTANDGNLRYIKLPVYIHGAINKNEVLQLCIYSDEFYNHSIYTSDNLSLADIYELTNITTGWIGNIRFTFNYENISKEQTYYLRLSVMNNDYDENHFISIFYDTFDQIYNDSTKVIENSFKFIIYQKEDPT